MSDREHTPGRILIDTDVLKISVVQRAPESAVLCFSGIGHRIGGIDIQSEEFSGATRDATAIFICDKKRSWANNLDFRAIADIISPYTTGRALHAIGNSMGGFIAIVSGTHFPLRSVVAFCPQFSVMPAIIQEDRWQAYISDIAVWRYPSLAGVFRKDTQYYVFGAPAGKDRKHLSQLPRLPNLHRIYFRDSRIGHHEARRLKDEGLLYPVIADCLNMVPAEDIILRRLAALPEAAYLASD